MANLDVAIGTDFATFNSLITGIANSFPSQKFVLSAGQASATFTFTPSQPPTLSANPNAQPVLVLSNVSLAVASASVNTTTTASVTFSFGIEFTPNGTLTLSVGTCNSIDTNDPQVTALAQQFGLGGSLVNYLNQFLSAISLPAFSLAGMNFLQVCEAGPPPSNDNFLMLYGALSPVVLPSPGTAWPTGTWFAAFDGAALSALGISYPFTISGYWSGGSFLGGHFSVSYKVKVLVTSLTPSTGNQVLASANCAGSAAVQYHTPGPLPNPPAVSASFSGTLNASVSLTPGIASMDVTMNSCVVSNLNGLGGLIGVLEELPLGEVFGAINTTIANAINGYNYNFNFLTWTSPSIAGTSFNIAGQNVAVNTITGPGGAPMSIITFELMTSIGS
jgi:hypothetical protein